MCCRRRPVDRDRLARLLKAAVASMSAFEGITIAAVEDTLVCDGTVTLMKLQALKSGEATPDQSVLEYLAGEAVRRAHLNEDWLLRFLSAGNHPSPREQVEKYFRRAYLISEHSGPPSNIPPPASARFVMRHKPLEDLRAGLECGLPVVLVMSLGGMGKTSLVREVARFALQGQHSMPRFDAAIWISDKEHEGTTGLATVLDAIAQVLDYPGLLNQPLDVKRLEIDRLLRRSRSLIIVDNFDTITDVSLSQWLSELPEPSKAVVTSREMPEDLRCCSYVVELKGMEEQEARELVRDRLQDLNAQSLDSAWADLKATLAGLGGNPMAIELVLGLVRRRGTVPVDAIRELVSSGSGIFDVLFRRAWGLLSADEQRLLLSMQLFPYGCTAAAIGFVSDMSEPELSQAAERLLSLSLLDATTRDLTSGRRYSVHSLVSAFLRSEMNRKPELERELRCRWASWYERVASEVGFCWDDVGRLRRLDEEGERETIEAVMLWTHNSGALEQFIRISFDLRYYYYVRGVWNHPYDLMRAEAARRLGDADEEFRALVYHANIASKQLNVAEVERHLPRLQELLGDPALGEESRVDYWHALALYHLARREYLQARKLWRRNVSSPGHSPHAQNANRRWLAVCLFEMGELEESRQLFFEVLDDARRQKFERGVVSAETYLARIQMCEGEATQAMTRLQRALSIAEAIGDRKARAEIRRLVGLVHRSTGRLEEAQRELLKALDDYERLGATSRVSEVRTELGTIAASLSSSV